MLTSATMSDDCHRRCLVALSSCSALPLFAAPLMRLLRLEDDGSVEAEIRLGHEAHTSLSARA